MADPEIAPWALPNDLAPADLLLRPDPDGDVVVDPTRAGWRYLSYEARPLRERTVLEASTGQETCIVVQAGHDVTITDRSGGRWALPGREGVFGPGGDLGVGAGTAGAANALR